MLSQEGCYSGLLEAQPVEVDSNLSQQLIFNMFKALDEESQTQVSFDSFSLDVSNQELLTLTLYFAKKYFIGTKKSFGPEKGLLQCMLFLASRSILQMIFFIEFSH